MSDAREATEGTTLGTSAVPSAVGSAGTIVGARTGVGAAAQDTPRRLVRSALVGRRPPRRPRRVAMLSVHTSPLHQPGSGDAGGMNVYIVQLARRLAELGTEVEIFTRATSSDLPSTVDIVPGVLVHHVVAGPYEGLSKEDLPGQLCAFTPEVLRIEATREPGHYDLVHSHYWLSGQVGAMVARRWGVPLVHSMHTLAKVKNAALAGGDRPEPVVRVLGEDQVVGVADRLVANTVEEARQLISHYGAEPDRVSVVNPGVDLDMFGPGDQAAARRRLGLAADTDVLLFVGRIQPLKAPEILLHAAARLRGGGFGAERKLAVVVVGGPSGNGMGEPDRLRRLAARLGIGDLVHFVDAVPQAVLADWYRAASVAVVPSFSESFGLVAIEAQACGTPVVAASVGGLTTAVRDGVSGVLIDGHDPDEYAAQLRRLLANPALRHRLSRGALDHARGFAWPTTAARILGVYTDAVHEQAGQRVHALVP